MKSIRISLALLLAVAMTASWGLAADTDFSGTWKLNAEKSDQPGGGGGRGRGGRGGPAQEMTITQTEDGMTISGGQRETVIKPGAGAQEMTGRMGGSQEASWEGANLVVVRNISTQRGDFKITTTWSVSDDGKTLTQQVSRDMGDGPQTSKIVYDKQSRLYLWQPVAARRCGDRMADWQHARSKLPGGAVCPAGSIRLLHPDSSDRKPGRTAGFAARRGGRSGTINSSSCATDPAAGPSGRFSITSRTVTSTATCGANGPSPRRTRPSSLMTRISGQSWPTCARPRLVSRSICLPQSITAGRHCCAL